MELTKATEVMREVLGLTYEPIAVKFLVEKTWPDGFEIPSERRYCQVLMGAREGRELLLTADNISCPAAAWALGFKEPPLKLSSGEMPAGMGIFGSPAAAKNTLDIMPRLEMSKYQMVACCPLGQAPFEPDVVVLESAVEHLMWVALADVFETGGRLEFSTAILQATCVDVTIIPFLTQKLNATLGCYGCREATNLAESECVLGFPIKDLENIVNSLLRLNEKAIPRVRGKAVYQALLSRRD
ncbi:MAG: DUF169 domain-containing protein [Dehalococcoidales bacterium]|nr:DUF169 domain-containing protein [Dehalococcoidales bacterium]